MKMTRKKIFNIFLFSLVLAVFFTPLGYYGKLFLNRMIAFSPPIIEQAKRKQITDYHWQLKDAEWNFFDFEKSKGKVIFVSLWASWRLPSEAELYSIQKLYDQYKEDIVFYIITDEERAPVEEFMQKKEFTFPVTYLIIGERSPLNLKDPPASFLIDKEGYIVVEKEGVANWNSSKIHKLLDRLIAE